MNTPVIVFISLKHAAVFSRCDWYKVASSWSFSFQCMQISSFIFWSSIFSRALNVTNLIFHARMVIATRVAGQINASHSIYRLISFTCLSWTVSTALELLPGISWALVTFVPGTAVAKDIPAANSPTFYSRLCETVWRLGLWQKLLSTFRQSACWLTWTFCFLYIDCTVLVQVYNENALKSVMLLFFVSVQMSANSK